MRRTLVQPLGHPTHPEPAGAAGARPRACHARPGPGEAPARAGHPALSADLGETVAHARSVAHTLRMIKLELLGGVITFALWVFCLVDVIGTPEGNVRNLPKVGWLVLVLLFPLVGSIAWLVAGRPEARPPQRPTAFPEYDRPGRAAVADPEKDEAFLREVRARAEEQRRHYEAEKRRREQQEPDQPA